MLFQRSMVLPVSETLAVYSNSFSLPKARSWRQGPFSPSGPVVKQVKYP